MMSVGVLTPDDWLDALVDRRNTVQLTMCRYDRRGNDWHIPAQRLDEHLVIFVERGAIDMVIGRSRVRLSPGRLVWLVQNTHRELWGVRGPHPLWHYKLRFRLFDSAGRHLAFRRGFVLVDNAHEVIPQYRQLIEEYQRPSRFHDRRVRSLVTTLLTEVLVVKERGSLARGSFDAARRRQIEEFVAGNLSGQIAPADLAAHVGLSLDYFTRAFRRTYGAAPRAYLKRERMRMGAHMLTESSASVKQVASSLGFGNVSFFCRQFRQVFGRSPTQYRG